MHAQANTHILILCNCSYPSIKPQGHGKSSIRYAATPIATVSARQGENASRRTAKDRRRSALGSSPSPARIRMTVSAICLLKKITR